MPEGCPIAAWDRLISSCDRKKTLARLPDAEIADRLLHVVWSELPMHTVGSDLLDEAIERLRARRG
jgi:hypothetical protein